MKTFLAMRLLHFVPQGTTFCGSERMRRASLIKMYFRAAEERFHALGKTNEGRRLHIAFTLRGDGESIRVIFARDMHRKERVIYEQAS
jgi:uncharacterized DUF497 family protein